MSVGKRIDLLFKSCKTEGLKATFRHRLLRVRERIWFNAPRWLHLIDVWVSGFRFKHNLYLPTSRNRGLRYFPREVVWVDPALITDYDTERLFASIHYVQDGDWDTKRAPFETKLQYMFVQAVIGEGKDLNNLDFLDKLLCKYMETGLTKAGAFELLHARCLALKKLANDIRTHGFKTQRELGYLPNNRFNTWYNEIRVSVDRNGKYIINGAGNHRLALAKVLGLKKVPVVIIRKHYKFLEKP